MEESDIRMSILCNADEKDILRRSQTAERLGNVLMNHEKFLNVLAVPKGKVNLVVNYSTTVFELNTRSLVNLFNWLNVFVFVNVFNCRC